LGVGNKRNITLRVKATLAKKKIKGSKRGKGKRSSPKSFRKQRVDTEHSSCEI